MIAVIGLKIELCPAAHTGVEMPLNPLGCETFLVLPKKNGKAVSRLNVHHLAFD
jgi:hypothetical protein